MLANKHTRNARLLSDPSDHTARGVPDQDTLARTPLWSTMMKTLPSGNGRRDPKQADGNNSRQLAQMAMARGHLSLGQLSPCLVTHGIQTPKTKPTKSPQQDSPVPSLPRKQTLQQLTPGPSGTQWSGDLFCEPSQTDEPPIPGPSPSSKPHEDVLTHEPEPEVALTQSMEETFARPTPPHSIIIIDNTPVGSPLPPLLPWFPPSAKFPSFPQLASP
ncbi:hypothetical protein O181_103720 [Austropuccinia psidii MF-1]|uniref:Uncharacterized protein n=1 Tax=Austropuccinia psidii MF-1 TaxID=1389203 RepID=A0A9Q3PK13_9BASI|nr:hypothetical protein [Austropuccinia psidii MF-1]